MCKILFTERKIITVLKSVEAGSTVNGFFKQRKWQLIQA